MLLVWCFRGLVCGLVWFVGSNVCLGVEMGIILAQIELSCVRALFLGLLGHVPVAFVFFSLPLLAFTAALDSSSTAFTVDGSVLLEDSEDHSGVQVSFYSIINPGEASASTLSDLEGNYILQVEPGFYLIKWEKYGYLPQELGDFTLNSDTTLNQVMMQPGFVPGGVRRGVGHVVIRLRVPRDVRH